MEDLHDILEGCKKNDRKSQEILYRQLYPAFFAMCKSFFHDHHDILTALNNGMLKVFKNINQYDESKGKFFNWAYTTVRNAALTLVRDKKTDITLELTDHYEEIADFNSFNYEDVTDIYVYLDLLPAKTRVVCCLFYLDGFSITEISKAIEMKEGTVKWHLSESRGRLKTMFEESHFKLLL